MWVSLQCIPMIKALASSSPNITASATLSGTVAATEMLVFSKSDPPPQLHPNYTAGKTLLWKQSAENSSLFALSNNLVKHGEWQSHAVLVQWLEKAHLHLILAPQCLFERCSFILLVSICISWHLFFSPKTVCSLQILLYIFWTAVVH